jgi:hypothetical protein
MKRTLISIAIAVLAITAMAVAPGKVKVEWHPKVGDHDDFKLDLTCPQLHAPDGIHELKIHTDLRITTIEIQKSGNIVVEEKFSAFGMTIDGNKEQSDPNADESKDLNTKTTYKPNGETIESVSSDGKKGEDDDEPSPFDTPDMIYPSTLVDVGDTWKQELKGDPAKKTYDTETTFTFKGTEEMDGFACYRIDAVETSKAPGDRVTSGSYWVAQDDGALIKAHFHLKNFKMDKDMPPSDGELDLDIKS